MITGNEIHDMIANTQAGDTDRILDIIDILNSRVSQIEAPLRVKTDLPKANAVSPVSGSLPPVPSDVIETLREISDNYDVIDDSYVVYKCTVDTLIAKLEERQ